jgi:membrane-associated phospholipid phosphatase
VASASFLVGEGSAAAQEVPQTHALRWDPAVDVAVTAGGAALWIASELLKGDLAPATCRWCAVDGVDAAARQAFLWHDPNSAARLSDVTGFLLIPLAAIGLDSVAAAHEAALGHVPEDVLFTTEAGVIAADVDQIAKFLVGRERPFVHALRPDEKPLTPRPADNNVSFFSGHTAEAFALAAASGTIGELRGYRWAPLTWAVGGALATTTAYLRIAADRHWLTDTLVGMLVGIGIGVGVPCLFHPALADPPRSTVTTALRFPALPATPTMTFSW